VGVTFTELEYVGPSQAGTDKAMGLWMAESAAGEPDVEGLPVLVIAVRGTAKFVDVMVNLNGRPIPAAEFLVWKFQNPNFFFFNPSMTDTSWTLQGIRQVPSIREAAIGISGHAGFLNSAMALHSSVHHHLSKMQQATPGLHVVFTGHSAGGAVASLLFVKCLLEASKSCKFLFVSESCGHRSLSLT
jgi:Lipase (class 3)